MDNNFNILNNPMNQGMNNDNFNGNNGLPNNPFIPIRNNNFLNNSFNPMGNNGNNVMNQINSKTMGSQPSNNNMNNQNQEMFNNLKKELEIEDNIRDFLKCYICLAKVVKPKMCKYCKRMSCEKCINKWIETHNFCGVCKHKLSQQDLIILPFIDDMSNYFLNNIDSHPKNPQFNNPNIKNNGNKNDQSSNPNNNVKVEGQNNKAQKKDICPIHNNKIDYYCIQCDKYFCSNCLVFFGDEQKKHTNHLIIQLSKMNNLSLQEAVNEYKKLPVTKSIIDNNIGLCKVKLKENQVKQTEIATFMNLVRDLYIQKIEENSQELNSYLNRLTNQREQVENRIASIPNGFNNIINSNDYAQGRIISEELKKVNKVDTNIEYEIKEKSKVNPKLFLDNYETDYLEICLPFSGQYNEGQEVFKKELNILPGFPSRILLKFLQKQIIISFSVDIDLPLNDPKYPKFYTYVTFKNGKSGLEFMNLSEQRFPQDFPMQGYSATNKFHFFRFKSIY